jgi:arsenite-transporting ATPase
VADLPSFLTAPPRCLFFTGKGGVGKTSIACAAAIALAEAGKRVLLISTDPASNLDEMLGVALSDAPRPVPGVAGLEAMNIDPEAAAEAYRARVLAQMQSATETERATVREQLSGACTTEVAAFDEFAALLAGGAPGFQHVLFDTAPTGHTLRLLSLPAAWTGFLAANEAGASCLGPHSGLKTQEQRFRAAMDALSDPGTTAIVLVARPDPAALAEAARSAGELAALGLANQTLVVNGVFHASQADDKVARRIERAGEAALAEMPAALRRLPRDEVPLRGFDMVGLPALRALLRPDAEPPGRVAPPGSAAADPPVPGLDVLVDDLAARGHGLVMVMGKGGVGKTTIAAAVAVGLVARGHDVHLSTTDPAAHLAMTLGGEMPGLRVDRIDSKAETERYVAKIMDSRGRDLDEAGRALLREDLRSPCTEEVAVFHAFSRIVAEARSSFVVLDTAPTGHTLLLMDATGAYHRQMTRNLEPAGNKGRIVTPLMRLQDPGHTQVLLVTLPETTPVSEAAALQEDLRRAGIEPHAWVVNRALAGSGAVDPLLRRRMDGEASQIARLKGGLAPRLYLLPWQAEAPVGLPALRRLAA